MSSGFAVAYKPPQAIGLSQPRSKGARHQAVACSAIVPCWVARIGKYLIELLEGAVESHELKLHCVAAFRCLRRARHGARLSMTYRQEDHVAHLTFFGRLRGIITVACFSLRCLRKMRLHQGWASRINSSKDVSA